MVLRNWNLYGVWPWPVADFLQVIVVVGRGSGEHSAQGSPPEQGSALLPSLLPQWPVCSSLYEADPLGQCAFPDLMSSKCPDSSPERGAHLQVGSVTQGRPAEGLPPRWDLVNWVSVAACTCLAQHEIFDKSFLNLLESLVSSSRGKSEALF